MKPLRSRWLAALAAAALILACALAWFPWSEASWPIDLVRRLVQPWAMRNLSPEGRLIAYTGKVEVPCPRQDGRMAVILAIGQSNIANHAAVKVTSRYPGAVLNYNDRRCYAAASPLLGATGEEGEFLTLLGDRLVADGTYQTIVLVPLGVGGSSIARWQRGGDLNTMLLSVLGPLERSLRVTEVIWHQGETDNAVGTSASAYALSFDSLAGTLRDAGVRAPIFIAFATKCGAEWTKDSPTAQGQHMILQREGVYLGADTDALLTEKDRRDGCHFSASGQEKTAAAFAQAIGNLRHTIPR